MADTLPKGCIARCWGDCRVPGATAERRYRDPFSRSAAIINPRGECVECALRRGLNDHSLRTGALNIVRFKFFSGAARWAAVGSHRAIRFPV